MLVVDLDALEAVDLLHLVDEVLLELLGTGDLEDLLRDDGAFGELLALLHAVALEHDDLLAHRDEVLLDESGDIVDYLHAALAAHVLAELDDALDLRDLGGVLGLAGLEELGDARKAARDVARLRGFAGRLREEHAGRGLHAVADHYDGLFGDVVRVDHLAVRVADLDARMQVGLGSREDDKRRGAARAVPLGLDGDVLLEVEEHDVAGRLGEDRHGVRVPRRDLLSLLHLRAVLDEKRRAHLELVGVELVAALGVDLERAVLVEDDLASLVVAHAAHVDELGDTVVLEDDLRDLRGRGRGSADVERTHRQLRAGLADGLRGDDADGRADLDLLAGREVASVALRAHSVLCVAGEAGADPDLLDAGLVDPVARLLVDDSWGRGSRRGRSCQARGRRASP